MRAFWLTPVLLFACGGGGRDVAGADDTLPQHPDAMGRAITVTPVGAGVGAVPIHADGRATDNAGAATYTVGPGQPYTSLRGVAPVLQPGDVVAVMGDATYDGGVRFERQGSAEKKIVIRGVLQHGKRPIISGGNDGIEAAGDHYVFDGLEITGATNRCFFAHADDITLKNSVVRDCPGHGVLTGDQDSGSFTMELDEVRGCGANGPTTFGRQRHQVYVATDERAHPHSTFRLERSFIHAGNGGNNVKSRAERNEIYSNWIEGAVYHELELIGPDGQDPSLAREDSDVVGNVFVKPNSFYVVRIGGDGTGATDGRYRFASNTFIVSSDKAVFRLFDGLESVEMTNNAFARVGGGAVTVLTDRDAKWSTKRRVVGGASNFLPSGSDAPPEWRGTVVADDPGLVDLAAFDLHPAGKSPLIAKATDGAPVLEAFPIDRTLGTPLFEPSRGEAGVDRGPRGKRNAAHPTIGALEARARPSGG